MVIYVFHDQDNYMEIILNQTVVAKKWFYVFMENLRYENLYTYINKTCKYTTNHKQTSKVQLKNIRVINESINKVNESIKGAKFPFNAYVGMDWEHSQKIHRAFTTSQMTKKAFEFDLSEKQLRELKYLASHEAMELIPELVEKTFDIIDQDKFELNSGKINHYIHHNELSIPSQRSDDMYEDFRDNKWIYYQWITENKELEDAGLAPTDRRFIVFTREDIEESANDPNWSEYDVYAFSNIFGKQYLETFLEYDSPLEVDVRNVQSVSGEFIVIDGPHLTRKRLWNGSLFTDWCDKYKLPRSVTHPIPIGRVNRVVYQGKRLLPNASDRSYAPYFDNLFRSNKPIQIEFKYHQAEPHEFQYKY